MADITLTIDGVAVTVPEGSTIMEAADKAGIKVPRLCYHPKLSIQGACRVCIVEVEGLRTLPASCCYPASDGMVVHTHTPEVLQLRRDIVELLLDNHPMDCNTCERDGNCELQRLAYSMGIRERLFAGARKRYPKDLVGPAVTRDPEKCILCGRCVRMCGEVQEVAALGQVERGFSTVVMPAHDKPFIDSVCTGCGQCINVCPTAAFLEKDAAHDLLAALEDPEKVVVSQMAPSVRAAIGEAFGLAPGKSWEGELFAAQRRMGIDYVFDTQFGADLTIMEEGAEFVEKLKEGRLPNITSCCPTWIKYCETFHPDLMQYLSSAKSPMSMQGAVVKTYWAEKMGIDPHNIYSAAFMCCTCKKFEAERPELWLAPDLKAVDGVCTTRELAWLMKYYGIDFTHLQPEPPDMPLGDSSGAGVIFGATGGVTEAALRSAYFLLFNEELPDEAINFYETRGLQGVREAWVEFKGNKLHIAIANSLGAANRVIDRLRAGEEFHWIEVMGCPGGCIGGGGQPYAGANSIPLDEEVLALRAKALYDLDTDRKIRRSHQNPDIQRLYREYLGTPLSEKAHHLLHTHYYARLPLGVRPQEAQV